MVIFALAFALLMDTRALRASENTGAAKPDIVELIEISGGIADHTAANVQAQVEKITEQSRIKAVVLVMNSPGGGALASSALYEAISGLKVPVVAWCSYVCASGGLYAVMAPSVKHVMVRGDTISGSVGAIVQTAHYHRLLDWAKIDIDTFKSGTLKDSGNPTRGPTAADRAYLQSIVDQLAERFYAAVRKGRPNIPQSAWSEIKTAKVFIGADAMRVGLVDSVGVREDAIKKAKELSGSKLIFTRDELKKMSKDANETTVYSAPLPAPQMHSFGDIASLVEIVKEMRQGESTTFLYAMPYRF